MKKRESVDYFDLLETMVDNINKTTMKLDDLVNNYNLDKLDEYSKKVHEYENNCDIIVHKIMNSLVSEFLPPIDREDISKIAHLLDDVEDNLDELFMEFKILDIKRIKAHVLDLTKIIVDCSKTYKEMFDNFKKLSNPEIINKDVISINTFETSGDTIYQAAITDLYKNNSNAIEILKWSNIYNCFENTIDSFEHVANIVEDAVMKNS